MASVDWIVSQQCCINLFRNPDQTETILTTLQATAQGLGDYFVVLDGKTIKNERDLLRRLVIDFHFPTGAVNDFANANWDGARDWLSDLSWLTGWPPGTSGVRGIWVVYTNPSPLFYGEAFSLATFLEVLSDACAEHRKSGIRFTAVVGPVEPRCERFIQELRVSNQACSEGQAMVLPHHD